MMGDNSEIFVYSSIYCHKNLPELEHIIYRPSFYSSQLHPQSLVHLQSLPNTQVQHNLLAPSGNCIGPHIPIQSPTLRPLPASAVTQAAEDLTRLSRAELECRCALGFQTCNGTS